MSDTLSITPPQDTTGVETQADFGKGEPGLWAYWMGQERIADKEDEKWVRRADRVIARYRDERPTTGSSAAANAHRFNILWSNVQTLQPVLYARTPKPVVKRRFLDKDPTGRLASLLLERSIAYSIDQYDFDAVMEQAVLDRLLPGRGQVRILYTPHFAPATTEPYKDVESSAAVVSGPGDMVQDATTPDSTLAGTSSAAMPNAPRPSLDAIQQSQDAPLTPQTKTPQASTQPTQDREVVYEETSIKYTYWKDYKESPARTWEEVSWVRYQAYMTRDELVERFGKKGERVTLDFTPKGADGGRLEEKPPPDVFKKAIVREYWDKNQRKVIWIAPGTPDLILDEIDDPLGLPDFFPSPAPLLATTTTDKRVPVPDYVEYQDQADEIDVLTARIDRLTRALKVSGVYPGSAKQELQQLIDDGSENKLIPVEDWASFAAKGGLKEMIVWMPVEQVAQTLIQLSDLRDRAKNIIYEITGIGDIVRGASQPMETAAAQKLKASFSTRRQVPEQKRVARFARDIVRLIGAVIAEHFSAATISAITGYPELQPVPPLPPPPPQMIPNPQAGPLAPQQPMQAMQPQMPGAPMAPDQQPPQQPPMVPNPAYQQWEQAAQARAVVIGANAAKQKQFDDAVALIKKDGVTGFRLDIETDSTIAADETQDRQDRTEFISALLPLMQQTVPYAMGNPAAAEFAKQLTMFGVRGFPIARSLEESIEQFFDQLATMPPQPPGGKPGASPGKDPQVEHAKIAADVHATDQKTATERMAIQQKAQAAQNQLQIATMRNESEQQRDMVDLAIQASEAQGRQDLQRHKIDARAATGLV